MLALIAPSRNMFGQRFYINSPEPFPLGKEVMFRIHPVLVTVAGRPLIDDQQFFKLFEERDAAGVVRLPSSSNTRNGCLTFESKIPPQATITPKDLNSKWTICLNLLLGVTMQ